MSQEQENNTATPYTMQAIGYIRSCFTEKFGIPRQPLLAPSATATLSLDAPFNDPDTVLGLEGVSHIWLSFIFHQHIDKPWKAKVRPPRLGGNKKVGVFATRSSFRPNHLGLSVVKLERIDTQFSEHQGTQVILHLSGVDVLDGTPVVDIKPYVPYADSIDGASNVLANEPPQLRRVIFHSDVDLFFSQVESLESLPPLIIEVLQQDPRPAYHQQHDERRYGMTLQGYNIAWVYQEQGGETVIVVVDVTPV